MTGAPEGLRFRRRTQSGCVVVRPSGVLGVASYAGLRAALLKEAADEPRAVVVDLDELRVEPASSLSVFPAVAAEMASWPGIPLVLACGASELAGTLWAGSVPRFVSSFTGVAAAVASVALPPPRRRRHVELPCTGGTPRFARRWVRDVCAEWGVTADDAAETVELVASELVENMVRHAVTPGRLRLEQHPAGLSVAVTDGDPRPPLHIGFGTTTGFDGGRGIAMVAALASAWGHSPQRPDGKVVWAVLPYPLPRDGRAPGGPDGPTVTATFVRAGYERSGLALEQMWLRYVAMGGSMRESRLAAILEHADVPVAEYDVLAHALNEHLDDIGRAQVPYRADLPSPDDRGMRDPG